MHIVKLSLQLTALTRRNVKSISAHNLSVLCCWQRQPGRQAGVGRRAWQQMKHHKVDTIPWGDEKSSAAAVDDDEREVEEKKKKSETEAKFKINFMTYFS